MATKEEVVAASSPMAFFAHDANAAQDEKCQRLILRRGWDGYGRWWRLCEHLAATKGHRAAFETDEDAMIMSGVLGYAPHEVDDCKKFIADLLDIGLLVADGNGHVESMRMQQNALYFGRQRVNGRKGGRPRKTRSNSVSAGQEV